tara:strand:- start:16936 stop:17115 length:180 start_codon:yes stop_codon:yes gene_type:complete
MKMNRKDFIVIADILKNDLGITDKNNLKEVAKQAAKTLKENYSNFNEQKFLERIGVKNR